MKGYIGLPFAPGSMTSREAALKGLKTCENLREDIWLVLRGEGPPGATAEEIGNMLMLSGNTVRPRLIELQALGRIDLTRNTRKTRSGRKAFT
jgi:predicted ArsR family transcriptional regulator